MRVGLLSIWIICICWVLVVLFELFAGCLLDIIYSHVSNLIIGDQWVAVEFSPISVDTCFGAYPSVVFGSFGEIKTSLSVSVAELFVFALVFEQFDLCRL